ncbi:MAG TPA: cation transporter [Thermoplasmatales archaeon]|nr:cation transporter [Thermoplasmatales archaeon]
MAAHLHPTRSSSRLAYTAIYVSIMVNVVLFAVKLGAGLSVDSVAMQADAWHTLSDSLTSVVVLLGFYIASRPPDREHPFGHGRAEPLAALVIGTLLAVVAFAFVQDSLLRLSTATPTVYSRLSILVFAASIPVKEGMARYCLWAGKKTRSAALRADGWHHRSDALSTVLVVAGALLGPHVWWVDGALGLLVSLFIFYAAYGIFREVAGRLLGESPDAEMEARIRDVVAREAPRAEQVHHLHLHRYGDHVELTLHLHLPPDMRLREVHDIAHRVEEALREEMGVEATVHVDPREEEG